MLGYKGLTLSLLGVTNESFLLTMSILISMRPTVKTAILEGVI